jgi:hypothetical protein
MAQGVPFIVIRSCCTSTLLSPNRSAPRPASERTKAALAAAKARGVKLGNPHGPKPFTAEARQQGVEVQRQQANARAQ